MALDRKARIREFIDTALNAGDIDATVDYFHEGVVEEVPFPGQGPGLEGLKSVLRQFRTAFRIRIGKWKNRSRMERRS
jgi:ketosteroid isomerase-like protein